MIERVLSGGPGFPHCNNNILAKESMVLSIYKDMLCLVFGTPLQALPGVTGQQDVPHPPQYKLTVLYVD